jgi:hypothetical protein
LSSFSFAECFGGFKHRSLAPGLKPDVLLGWVPGLKSGPISETQGPPQSTCSKYLLKRTSLLFFVSLAFVSEMGLGFSLGNTVRVNTGLQPLGDASILRWGVHAI